MALVLAPRAPRRALAKVRGAIGVAAVMLVFSPMAAVNAVAAGTPTAPVIKEKFTALPCNHATTVGLEGCAEGRLLATDRRINLEVALLFKLLGSTSQRRTFVTSEDVWFTYRTADCESVAATYQGGSLAPVEFADCEVADNESRSVDLHSHFELVEQDNDAAPTWP